MKKPGYKLLVLCVVGCCLVAPLSFSLAEIPFRLQSLAVLVAAAVAGKRYGAVVPLAYLLLGAVGLPVFPGFGSGWEKLIGPTAGFLWGFVPVGFYIGWACHHGPQSLFHFVINMFRAHLLWLIPGFIVLYFSYPGADIFASLIRMMPDVLIKSLLGGILAWWITKKLLP